MLAADDVATRISVTADPRTLRSHHMQVSETLRGYAESGAFRSFAEGTLRSAKATYRLLWHYNRTYRLILDLDAMTLAIADMLPGVPAKSPMIAELRAFLKPFGTDKVPEHRRVDPDKGELKLSQYRQALTLRMAVRDQEFVYCTRKLVHVAHEVFMVFLREGPYYQYRVDKLGLDPDVVWA
jgi:hypothetical protein